MVMPTCQISWGCIKCEFGVGSGCASDPVSISKYYSGCIVHNCAVNFKCGTAPAAFMPTSGQISASDFQGSAKTKVITGSSSACCTGRRTLCEDAVCRGWNPASEHLTYCVPYGSFTYSTCTSLGAFHIQGPFPYGVTVINCGNIIGAGGCGGAGGSGLPTAGADGGKGGPAITVSNVGTGALKPVIYPAMSNLDGVTSLRGGGGGGGGGGGANYADWYGGTGGGGGESCGPGGAAGCSTGPAYSYAGASGSCTNFGCGGGGHPSTAKGGRGGLGGLCGVAGASSAQRSGGAGGPPGAWICGSALVTLNIICDSYQVGCCC